MPSRMAIPKEKIKLTKIPHVRNTEKDVPSVLDFYNSIYTSYLHLRPEQWKEDIDGACKRLFEIESNPANRFDAIAFAGMSGAIIAPMVAYKLNKPLIVVRKESDTSISGNSHSSRMVEGCIFARTYLIIDDFIDTGNTIKRIIDQIKVAAENKKYLVPSYILENPNYVPYVPKCVGVYCYSYSQALKVFKPQFMEEMNIPVFTCD